eukprot:10293-Heterococcus_DN1.PRE.1
MTLASHIAWIFGAGFDACSKKSCASAQQHIYQGEDEPENPNTPRDDRSKSSKRGAATSRFRLDDSEFREAFVKGSGPGGQKINKVRSCVQLTHIATGIQVQCQDARDLVTNRALARKWLAEKVEHHLKGAESKIGRRVTKIQKKKAKSRSRARTVVRVPGTMDIIDGIDSSAADSDDDTDDDASDDEFSHIELVMPIPDGVSLPLLAKLSEAARYYCTTAAAAAAAVGQADEQ